MIKTFREIFSLSNDIILTDVQSEGVRKDIVITNMRRLRIGLSILVVFETLLAVFYDLNKIEAGSVENRLIYFGYLFLHLSIALVSLIGFILFNRAINKKLINKANIRLYEVLVYLALGLILIFLTLITGLDQITTGQIIVFGVNIIYSGLVILIKPKVENVMYAITFIIYIIVIIVFQHNSEILFSNLINGTLLFISALFLCKFVYNNHFMHLAKNIKLEEVNKRLQYLSDNDLLTGIPNRRYFIDSLKEDIHNTSEDNKGSSISIMDIDHFKQINDTYGHPAGDLVLKQIASILNSNIQKEDMVARFGGEEFIILFYDTSLEEAKIKTDNIRNVIDKCVFNFQNQIIHVTASFGISELNNVTEKDFDKAYSTADMALYRAKKNGRNRVELGIFEE
ncbi:GGDEF domain-containing protein [Clostridium sp. C8-1-8]|uniref:GGDEF domain-containing protein n=1 Tax=Clostridium sp. C8-1-8 TaxID=2698831 RepID=UPI00136F8B8A|nr:GGDEF domain-containing protein [Clostridium sp. C8-1-8]